MSMDLTASAIKPGRRSLNRASMDVRRARGAIKDPSHTKSRDVSAELLVECCVVLSTLPPPKLALSGTRTVHRLKRKG